MNNIRNFSIIAHIDHGKSTLADRMLELTGTIEKRKMREQVLDSMELERERGITIKMQPVRMKYQPTIDNTQPTTGTKKGNGHELLVVGGELSNSEYVLNLIDTPGHIDFSYEVSRALRAVEGALLLVDATQGVQAQTLTTLSMARELGLVIVPVVSKIDSPLARPAEVREELVALLNCPKESVLMCSGKTGEGVPLLLSEIVRRIPPPKIEQNESTDFRALVFDFKYSDHRGIIMYLRVFSGAVQKGNPLKLSGAKERFTSLEVGIFNPNEYATENLGSGEIGYCVTGIKKPRVASVGDTLLREKSTLSALPGYITPKPVVWASLYPESQDDLIALRHALERLELTDAALSFEEESSGALGRGFRCGFLGMLHIEIVTERLRRESKISFIVTAPSITYEIWDTSGRNFFIYSPIKFPEYGHVARVQEPWTAITLITPASHLGAIMPLLYKHEAEVGESETFGDGRVKLSAKMPLRELMRNFFDRLKSVSSGYASLSYEPAERRDAQVARLDILVADEVVPAFSRIIGVTQAQEEAEAAVERLEKILPRQLFAVKIQARALGRILASRRLPALKKDVTGYLYGGDITRKRKLWEKQKRGKKKMQQEGKVHIPHNVFLSMLRHD